jgi:hypothetical protein
VRSSSSDRPARPRPQVPHAAELIATDIDADEANASVALRRASSLVRFADSAAGTQ